MLGKSAIRSVFIGVVLVLFVSFAFVYVMGRIAVDSSRRLAYQRAVLLDFNRFLSSVKDAETGQRGYLLTGDERYLEPYRQAKAVVRQESAALLRLAAEGALARDQVARLNSLSEEKFVELERTIDLRRSGGLDQALELVKGGSGKALMDRIRAEVDRMALSETRELEDAAATADSTSTLRTAATALTFLFNLLFLSWAYRRLSRETKSREEALLETSRQKELISTTLSSIGDGVIVTDAGGRITFLNAEAERLTGWNHSEAAGRPLPEVFRIVNEQTRRALENPVDKILRQGNVVGLENHTVLISRTGSEAPIDDSVAPIRQPGAALFGVVLVFRDVTRQRHAEEARARLAAIVESSGDAIVTVDMDGIVQTWNEGARTLFGYEPAEIIGHPASVLFPLGQAAEVAANLERLREGSPSEQRQGMLRSKTGQRVPVLSTLSPLRNVEGRLTGASVILRDITPIVAAQETLARGHHELERLVDERTTSLREMIDELQHVSYAISHDMRAPLRAMGTFAQMLFEDAQAGGLSAEMIDYCRRIVIGAGRLDALINDALNYTQAVLQHLPLEPVNLSTLLRGLLDTYPNFHPDKADIRVEGDLAVVLGNESLLTQCFSNLLGNAVKFVAPGVRPIVRVRSEAKDGSARIWVEDNGIGIPRNSQSRLFGMFQKLDTTYEGRGVGLAIVRKVVERMGGKVGVESEPGKGSRFWVDLPLATVAA
ncbi:MAG TPA: PAS domain S-box protein [Planctomycetota bacterium]|nr:PAS domain S-box protein [Planctomycetota bacterium]